MKKMIFFVSLLFCNACSDHKEHRWSIVFFNKSAQDIVLMKFNTIRNIRTDYQIKVNQKVEFSAASEVLRGIPPDSDSLVITFNDKKIIHRCKFLNSEFCIELKSLFDTDSYIQTVNESRNLLKITYTYEFTNDDLNRGK